MQKARGIREKSVKERMMDSKWRERELELKAKREAASAERAIPEIVRTLELREAQ